MNIEFAATGSAGLAHAALVVLALDKGGLTHAAKSVDEAQGGLLTRAIGAGRFTGAKGQVLDLVVAIESGPARLALLGTGAEKDVTARAAEGAGAQAWKSLATTGVSKMVIRLGAVAGDVAAHAAFGAALASYRFDRYRTKEKAEAKPSVTSVVVECDDPAAARKAFDPLKALADAMFFSRDLVSEPANILHPAEFASRVKALESLGLEVEILDEDEMTKLGMGALLGVGQGSRRESQLAVIQWKGAEDANAQPIAFVGKGVTFDTGGISIKPADGMEEMKGDMGGAAAVAGLMQVLAARKAKVNVVGILGLVENMPDGNAQRPGDIVTSMSGQTIEVINTDAEGRLVLADALWYCQDRFKPQFMIDLATLTGAIIIALGNDYAGLFSNNDDLSAKLLKASDATGELLWRLPIPASYEKQIDTPAADVKNTGGRPGGSITAALFLQRFTNGLPWAHLDIASTAWSKPGASAISPEWASGFGVRLLNQLVADHYEA